MRSREFVTAAVVAASLALAGAVVCASDAPAAKPPPSVPDMAEFWTDPATADKSRFDIRGGRTGEPTADGTYQVEERNAGGFSITYRVTDANGAEWSVKIGPEAQPEVVSSHIVFALGYHQLPSYFVERWTAVMNGKRQTLGGGRFRPRPRDLGLISKGTWSWTDNPFVGAREYKGLLALMMILNSTDLKDDNNELFEIDKSQRSSVGLWYVVKDLGATLGETGRFDPRRGYIDGFEREPFITGEDHGVVRFAFKGRHRELLQHVTVDDVKWISERVLRLSDRQWQEAFGAGGYDETTTARYVARIKAKAAEGMALR